MYQKSWTSPINANLHANQILAHTLIVCLSVKVTQRYAIYFLLMSAFSLLFQSIGPWKYLSLFGIVLKLQNLNFCIMLIRC